MGLLFVTVPDSPGAIIVVSFKVCGTHLCWGCSPGPWHETHCLRAAEALAGISWHLLASALAATANPSAPSVHLQLLHIWLLQTHLAPTVQKHMQLTP